VDSQLATVWRFVRGDTTPAEFEQWAYSETTLEALLGPELYMRIISTDYRDRDAVWRVRGELEHFARAAAPMACECVALADTAVVDMANPGRALDHLEEIRQRGDPYWWLHLSRCSACGTSWLVAQEERQNDVFLLHRLDDDEVRAAVENNIWPVDFDRYETLLRLGKAAGHSVTFLDPVGDSSLSWTMQDLARERPGIRLDELAALLNLDRDTAMVIAREAILVHGVEIDVR
jgi:hypothetical protein